MSAKNGKKDELRRREIVFMTPAMAKAWLDRNHNNRAMGQTWIDELVRHMHAGTWEPQRGVPIQITPEGNLGNGQHRLAAVVAFGSPVWMAVEYDVPLAEAVLGDVARPKSYADYRHQVCGASNASFEVATARAVAHIAINDFVPRVDGVLGGVILENEEGIRLGISKRGTGIRALVWGAVAFAYPVHPEKVRLFAEQLATGAGLNPGSPVLALRNSLLARGAARCDARGGTAQHVIATKVLSALYHYVRGHALAKVLESDTATAWWRKQRRALGLDSWVLAMREAA